MTLVLVAAILTYTIPTIGGIMGGGGDDGRTIIWGVEATTDEGIIAEVSDYGVTEEQLESWGVDPASDIGWEFPNIGQAVGTKFGGEGFGLALGSLLTIAAVMSMIGLFTGNSLGGTRVPFALAEDGMFPRFLVKVHNKYGTPFVAIIVTGVIYSIFSLNAFAFLVVADVFLQMLVILAEFAAMWVLRYKMPDRPRDRVPGGWFGMFLVTLGPTLIIILAIYSQIVEVGFLAIGWALVFMAVGVVLYFPFRKYLKPGVPDVDPFEESLDYE